MMRPRTLRARVLLGALLWTIGFFAIITMALTFSVHARDSVMVIHRHNAFSGCIAIICMLAGLALVRGGLIPFDDMRRLKAFSKLGFISSTARASRFRQPSAKPSRSLPPCARTRRSPER